MGKEDKCAAIINSTVGVVAELGFQTMHPNLTGGIVLNGDLISRVVDSCWEIACARAINPERNVEGKTRLRLIPGTSSLCEK